jgi:hypothetical protein
MKPPWFGFLVTRNGRVLLALATAAAVLLGACGGSGFRYVGSAEDSVFMKAPLEWTLFTPREMLEATGLESEPEGSRYRWMIGFDAAPEPRMENVIDFTSFPEHPVVIAWVRDINFQEQDRFSLNSIRNERFTVDQLLSEGGGSLISQRNLLQEGGFHGEEDVFTIRNGVSPRASLTIRQLGLTNPSLDTLYFLQILCTSSCYNHNESQINQVADSWTVEEK